MHCAHSTRPPSCSLSCLLALLLQGLVPSPLKAISTSGRFFPFAHLRMGAVDRAELAVAGLVRILPDGHKWDIGLHSTGALLHTGGPIFIMGTSHTLVCPLGRKENSLWVQQGEGTAAKTLQQYQATVRKNDGYRRQKPNTSLFYLPIADFRVQGYVGSFFLHYRLFFFQK